MEEEKRLLEIEQKRLHDERMRRLEQQKLQAEIKALKREKFSYSPTGKVISGSKKAGRGAFGAGKRLAKLLKEQAEEERRKNRRRSPPRKSSKKRPKKKLKKKPKKRGKKMAKQKYYYRKVKGRKSKVRCKMPKKKR